MPPLRADDGSRKMKQKEVKAHAPVGLGMYTVHQAVKEDLAGCFCRVAQMGYQGIEFYGELSDFPAESVRAALAESKLEITGWHVEWANLQEELWGNTVEYLHRVGCKTAIIPCLGGKWNVGHSAKQECRDRWLYYIDWMNRMKDRLNAEGIRLGYHNHEHEFLLKYENQSVFDLLYENLAPDIVMEFDSGNCIEGGADPVRVLQKYADRKILLHLKPYSFARGFDIVLGEAADENDWPAILNVPDVSFEWLLVESENGAMPEMENAQRCLKNLKKYLAIS